MPNPDVDGIMFLCYICNYWRADSAAFQRLLCSPTPFWEPQILNLSISDPNHHPVWMYWFSKPCCLPYSLDLRDMVAAHVVMSSKVSICLILCTGQRLTDFYCHKYPVCCWVLSTYSTLWNGPLSVTMTLVLENWK